MLSDQSRYIKAVERIYDKYLTSGRVQELRQEGVSLAAFYNDRTNLCRILAKSVSDGHYALTPGRLKRVKIEDKERTLFSFCLTDLIIHAVVAQILTELAEPYYSKCLFSYRKKFSTRAALDVLAEYMRAHLKNHPEPKNRGVYVLKRDIRSYTDSIPVHARSRVWTLLVALFGCYGVPDITQDPLFELVREVIRPTVFDFSGGIFTLYCGVPTGSPISVFLFNFYLADFDAELEKIKNTLYLRYSDDFILVSENKTELLLASQVIVEKLQALELSVKEEKNLNYFFNGAGKHPDNFPGGKGTQVIHFLGWSLRFNGSIGLGEKKCQRLRHDLRERIFKTNRILSAYDLETRGRLICRTINEVFRPSNIFSQAYAGLLLKAVNDRSQLKEIDLWIVRMVMRVLIGDSSVRAFRKIPYRKIRQKWGLISLVHNRNRLVPLTDDRKTVEVTQL